MECCSPDKSPHIAQFVDVKFSKSAGQIVGNAYVVDIKEKILEGDMNGKEGRRQEKAEKERMRRHHRRRLLLNFPKYPKPRDTTHKRNVGHASDLQPAMKSVFVAGLCALSVLAATPHQQLVQLASAGNGIIRLNPDTFDLLTSPRRTWSATIQLTALDKRRRCNPCRLVFHHMYSAAFYFSCQQRI